MRLPALRRLGAVAFLVGGLVGAVHAQEPTPSPVASPPPVVEPAAESAEIEALRSAIAALRAEYSARLAELEARLDALAPKAAEVASEPPPSPPPEPAPLVAPATPPPSASSKVFNPDIAVIGDFLGAAGHDPGASPSPALEMHEAEASFQAAVDPYARADFFFAFSPEGVEVEEAYLTFPTLPGGLLMEVGKLRGSFGKVNTQHNHALTWTDRPLVTRNLVGGEEGLADAGFSLSRLVPNSFAFFELTGEVYRGGSELYQSPRRQDLTWLGRARAYRDLTESANLDLGTSLAWGRDGRTETSATRLVGLDATFRWRPLRRAMYERLLARTELVWSRWEDEAALATPTSFGFYASAEYQFARRFFAGARVDRSARPGLPDAVDTGQSLLLTFWPSEFSQVRGQFRRTRYDEGTTAHEFLFQFLFSIGAHGAHVF
ncbi:MAG: hypothetical protein NDJ94_18825 [Vicinamibacteria bacterium]|nr:hypothetical protein [Vicinamibacteria bacterium]